MIIHRQQVEDKERGNGLQKLLISYINKEGNVGVCTIRLNQDDMFEWRYATGRTKDAADKPFYVYDYENKCYKKDENGNYVTAQWLSYDNKPIYRHPVGVLPVNRLNEILCSYGSQIDPLFEMNVPNTWFCDIETEVNDSGFPDPEQASTRINTISMSQFPRTIVWARKNLTSEEQQWVQDSIEHYSEDPELCGDITKKDITKGYKFEFRYFSNEHDMLQDFINFCITVTAIAGWNFLNFDWLYIYNRCRYNNIDMKVLSPTMTETTFKITPRSGGATINLKLPMHKLIYDYLLVFKTWDQTVDHCENHTLDYIAKRVLGIGKKPHSWGFAEGFDKHFADYVFYNSIDTIILEQIDKEINTAKIWYMLASILRIDAYDAFSTIRPTETVMANFMYGDYKVIPSDRKKIPTEQTSYEGAFVVNSQKGVYRMVGGLDFASLYPSIMRQFNVSPEVFIKKDKNYVPKENEIKMASGAVYSKTPGLIPRILTDYYGRRKQAKNDMKQAATEQEYYEIILKRRIKEMKERGEKVPEIYLNDD